MLEMLLYNLFTNKLERPRQNKSEGIIKGGEVKYVAIDPEGKNTP